MSKSRGFTLIELLITVSIIAILAAIGLVMYSNAIKQGRDSKRQSDLRSIQSALEQYYNDQFFYPSNSVPNAPNLSMNKRLQDGGPFDSNIGNPLTPPLKIYINFVPQDPASSTQPYVYVPIPYGPNCDNSTSTSNCTSYCLFAKLENPPSPIPPLPTVCAPIIPLVPFLSSYNFAVTPP